MSTLKIKTNNGYVPVGGAGNSHLSENDKEWLQQNYQPKGDYLENGSLNDAINEALTQAKDQGIFDGENGKDGGHYTPSVSQPESDKFQIEFVPSKADMPAVDPVQVELPHSGGNVDGKAIIDVVELPTENIRDDVFYRLLSGSLVSDQLVQNMYAVHCVKELPETGSAATNPDKTEGNVYYVTSTGEVYGYIDEMLSMWFGIPVGWYPGATLLGALGLKYGGVITDILDDPSDGKLRVLLEYETYSYKDEWKSYKSIGMSGTGVSAEIFNDPANIASGLCAHAEGGATDAVGDYSHAEGKLSAARGRYSHAEGCDTVSVGDFSHAEGCGTSALGDYSHAEGQGTTASGEHQHVQGRYNIGDTESKYVHIVGNGVNDQYSNAHTLDWDGNAWYAGDVYTGGTGQDDPNAVRLATMNDIPAIVTEASGEFIVLNDSSDQTIRGLNLYGKTIQNGTPTPDAPVIPESIGNDGNISVKIGTSETDENPQIFSVSTPNGLPGIPVSSGGNYTDESGQQWICDEVDYARGVYVQRVNAFIANRNTVPGGITQIKDFTRWQCLLGGEHSAIPYVWGNADGFFTHAEYVCKTSDALSHAQAAKSNVYITLPTSLVGTSVAEIKAYMAAQEENGTPLTVVYILETPITRELTAEELAGYAELHTVYPYTVITADGAMMDVKYVADTKSYIDYSWGHRRYDLPLLSLTGDTAEMTKDNAVTMNYRYVGRSGTCTVKWQGSSSLKYPKKNFTIKFDTAFEAKEGWGEQKKYCLKANFIDPSHARNIVSAGLWSKVVGLRNDGLFGTLPKHGAIDGFPIILEINGEFWGLYTFNIPKDGWMFGLSDSTLTQAIVCAEGNLDGAGFKREANLDGKDFSLEYVSDENNSDWVKTSLNRLITACINSDGTDLDTTIAQYLDWRSAIDFYIFTCLIGAYDLMVKNYILVTLDGTKWYFSAYDMDSTFGLEWTGKGFRLPNGCTPVPATYGNYHRVMDLITKYKKDELKARFTQIKALMSVYTLHNDFYNFASAIPQTVLDEDWKKWPTIPGTSCNNAAQIMDWYRCRIDYIAEKINAL